MSIEGKHFYRFNYLKSEHWQTLRIKKIGESQGRCCLCDMISPFNDVHHIRYCRLYDVTSKDLVVLCRDCHKRSHDLMGGDPIISKLKGRKQWAAVKASLLRKRTEWVVGEFSPDWHIAACAKKSFTKAMLSAPTPFPNIRKDKVLEFFKRNTSPSQQEWSDFALSKEMKPFRIKRTIHQKELIMNKNKGA